MNPLHLLWIVPTAALLGFIICALLTVSSKVDKHADTMRDSKEEK